MIKDLFPSFHLKKKIIPYMKYPRWDNLCVLPYLRDRLIFSQLAAMALEEGGFDAIVVDLPYFMNERKWLEIPLTHFPAPISLSIRQSDGRYLFLPLVPNNAAYLSLYLAATKGIDYQCVDDSNLLNYPEGSLFIPETPVKDDYFIFQEGIKRYFSPVWRHYDRQWHDLSILQKTFTGFRASVVAGRLKKRLSNGERILFVCEHQLWCGVDKVLKGELEANPAIPLLPRWQDGDGALVIEDPYFLWIKGVLDDFPFITNMFCEHLKKGTLSSFNKLSVLNNTLNECINILTQEGSKSSSLRRRKTFKRFLRNSLALQRRITPLPVRHLFEAVRSCLGKESSRAVASKLLSYPLPEGCKSSLTLGFLKLLVDAIRLEGNAFEIPDILDVISCYAKICHGADSQEWKHDEDERKQWVDQVHHYLTKNEERKMPRAIEKDGGMWALKEEFSIHAQACSQVRELVSRGERKVRIERSRGYMGDGVHWKSTIAAFARGEKALYIKRRVRRNQSMLHLDEYTPTVFIFEEEKGRCLPTTVHSGNSAYNVMSLKRKQTTSYKDKEIDTVNHIFKMVSERGYFLKSHVRKDVMTSLALLYTKDIMEVERYEAIVKKPRKYQCRTTPDEDYELRNFSFNEKAVAWAAKYAEKAVLVIAYPGWNPSGHLKQFVRKKQVKLITLPLTIFPPDLIERLRSMHFISPSLKVHPDQEKIVRRFLRNV